MSSSDKCFAIIVVCFFAGILGSPWAFAGTVIAIAAIAFSPGERNDD